MVSGPRGSGHWEMMAKGSRISFGGTKSVPELVEVMFAQICEYTKNH